MPSWMKTDTGQRARRTNDAGFDFTDSGDGDDRHHHRVCDLEVRGRNGKEKKNDEEDAGNEEHDHEAVDVRHRDQNQTVRQRG